jgi:HEAT repeat protein
MESVELRKIVEDLKSPRPFVRGKAVDTLMHLRDEAAIPALFKIVQKEMDFIKVQYCRFIGRTRSAAGVAPLVAFILGSSEKVAAEATAALDLIDHDKKTEALIYLVGEKNRFAKIYAMKALAAERKIKAVPVLVNALSTGDPELKELAIDTLRQIGDAAAIAPLVTLLEDPEIRTLYVTIYALGDIGDKSTAARIAPFLRHEDADIRRAAVWALAKLHYSRLVPTYIEMLKSDPSDEVREEVCRRLGAVGGRQVVEPLCAAKVSDKAHNVRVYAEWALQEILGETKDAPLAREIEEFLKGTSRREAAP